MAKLSISLDDKLLARVDEYAEHNYLTRSGCISQALAQMLTADEVARALSSLAVTMAKISENGTIDEQSRKELQEFSAVAALVAGGGKR